MAVLEPLKVTIENYPNKSMVEIDVPNFPNDETKGSHKVDFNKVVYIDSCDFQEVVFFLIFSFILADLFYFLKKNENLTEPVR